MSDKAKASVFGNRGFWAFENYIFSWQNFGLGLFCRSLRRHIVLLHYVSLGHVGVDDVAAAACGLDDVEHHAGHDSEKILHSGNGIKD